MCVADNKNAHNFAWLDEKFAEINLSTTPQGDGGASKEGEGNDSQAPHRFICQTLIENYFWKQPSPPPFPYPLQSIPPGPFGLICKWRITRNTQNFCCETIYAALSKTQAHTLLGYGQKKRSQSQPRTCLLPLFLSPPLSLTVYSLAGACSNCFRLKLSTSKSLTK